MYPLMLAHVFLYEACLNLLLNFADDGVKVILVLELELLVVGPALVRGPFLEYFGESVENFCLSPLFFGDEVLGVFEHEAEVDLVFP